MLLELFTVAMISVKEKVGKQNKKNIFKNTTLITKKNNRKITFFFC